MKIRLALVSAVLLLALTGCSESVASAGDSRVGTAAAASASPTPEGSPTASPEPIVAETPGAVDPHAREAFLEEARSRIARVQTQIPNVTSDQLFEAGAQACERLAGGESSESMSLIEGEELSPGGYYMDSGAIISAARLTLCPSSTE